MITGLLFALLFGVVPLAVIAGIIAAVGTARHEADLHDEPDTGIGTVRRLFIYGLALVGLSFAASGVALLIQGALEALIEQTVIANRSQALSVALAFTLVGTPAWIGFSALAQRSVAAHAAEGRSQARRLYFALARGIALGFVAANALAVGDMLLRVDDFAGGPWGWMLAWTGVWVVHTRFAANEPPMTVVTQLLERLYGYFGAVLGLYITIGGVVAALTAPLAAVYDRTSGASLVDTGWSADIRRAAVLVAVGGAIWAWHWLRGLAASDRRTTLWYVQIFVFGTLAGVALTVVPLAAICRDVLQWVIGAPTADSASAHFAQMPSMLAAFITGVGVWGYHRALVTDAARGDTQQTEPERVYRYMVTAAGLFTAAIGLASLLALTADALGQTTGDLARSDGWWRNGFVQGVTLSVIGAPLWARYWFGVQQLVLHGDLEARASVSRRVFLFAAVGISLLALIISMTVVLFQFFLAALDSELGRAFLHDARWGLATALTSAGIAGYYFLILREDQAAMPEAAAAQTIQRREVVLVAGAAAETIAEALREIDGVRVRVWRRTDSEASTLTAEQLAALREQVRTADAARLVVVVGARGFEVAAYAEGG